MATTPLLTRRTALYAKAEAVAGTAETLAAADGKFLIINPQVTPQFENFERQIFRDTLSPVSNTVTRQSVQFTFQVEVRRTNGTTTSDEWAETLLPACAMKETVGASSVSYTPSSNQSEWATLTMALNIDGFEVKIAGAMGTVEFTGTVGEVMLASFTFTGFLESAGDVVAPAVTHESGLPHPFQGIDLAYATGTRFLVVADASSAATAGSFTLTVDGLTTAAIAYDDDGTAATTALETLFGSGNATCTMVSGAALGGTDSAMLVEIANRAKKAVSIDPAGLTGGAYDVAATAFVLTADSTAATAGTFTVTVDSNGTPGVATLDYDADASDITTAFDALSMVTASRAIFTAGSDLGTNNASVIVIFDEGATAATNYHIKANFSGLTGNVHTLDASTQEIATGDDICIESLTITLGNDVQLLTCANNNSGIVRYTVVGRTPTITLNPQLTKEAEVDGLVAYWDHLIGQTMTYLSLHAGNLAGQDSAVSFLMPEVFWSDIGQEDRNGIAVAALTGALTSDSAGGDDELTVTLS